MGATLIDDFLPRWHFHEVHRVVVDVPGPVLLDAALTVTWREAPLAFALMRLTPNKFTRDSPLMEVNGEPLARSDDEVLWGGIDDYRDELDLPGPLAEVFKDWHKPGCVKVLLNLRAVDGELTTETRVYATDERARREFRRMWLVVRPGSGLVRRSALRAIRRRAARVGS